VDNFASHMINERFNAYEALLLALTTTHPHRDKVRLVFEQLMADVIERQEDPAFAAYLQAFEDRVRVAIEEGV
jgi:hypothetical protein